MQSLYCKAFPVASRRTACLRVTQYIALRVICAGRFLIEVRTVSSPQGRFAGGASVLDGRQCDSVEAYGKHLVLSFDDDIWLHIHLGLFGRIRRRKVPALEPKGAVRVRLESQTHVVDVSGPTICSNVDRDERDALIKRIGPDVLRDDADPAIAVARISRSRAPIGRLLMDQAVIAGIGNIYRTELLWRAGIHPDTQGRSIDEAALWRLWEDAKRLLELGVKRNAIITSDRAMRSQSRYKERTNIFGKSHCPACQCEIRRIDIAGRRAFICVQCQPRAEA